MGGGEGRAADKDWAVSYLLARPLVLRGAVGSEGISLLSQKRERHTLGSSSTGEWVTLG